MCIPLPVFLSHALMLSSQGEIGEPGQKGSKGDKGEHVSLSVENTSFIHCFAF